MTPFFFSRGEMAEWLKVLAWKASVGEILPRVRISLSPLEKNALFGRFFV